MSMSMSWRQVLCDIEVSLKTGCTVLRCPLKTGCTVLRCPLKTGFTLLRCPLKTGFTVLQRPFLFIPFKCSQNLYCSMYRNYWNNLNIQIGTKVWHILNIVYNLSIFCIICSYCKWKLLKSHLCQMEYKINCTFIRKNQIMLQNQNKPNFCSCVYFWFWSCDVFDHRANGLLLYWHDVASVPHGILPKFWQEGTRDHTPEPFCRCFYWIIFGFFLQYFQIFPCTLINWTF